MGPARYEGFDPLLPAAGAESMLRLCERFGRYGMYDEYIAYPPPASPETSALASAG